MSILSWIVIGLVAGALARLFIPGRQPIGVVLTIALGIAGSFVGGALSWAFVNRGQEPFHPAGILMSILGATLLLGFFVMFRARQRA